MTKKSHIYIFTHYETSRSITCVMMVLTTVMIIMEAKITITEEEQDVEVM